MLVLLFQWLGVDSVTGLPKVPLTGLSKSSLLVYGYCYLRFYQIFCLINDVKRVV